MGDTLIAGAEKTGRCLIRANAMVREVTVDAEGRATGCIYIDEGGTEHRVRAAVVCVCCSAVESARLLLLSTSARFPDGLANGSGLVGRYLQFHTVSGGRGRFRLEGRPHGDLTDPTSFLGRSLVDFYFLPEGVSDLPKGGLLRFDLLRPSPIFRAQEIAREGKGGPLWGQALKQCLRERFRGYREVEFEAFQDFLPSERTFLELDPDVKDRWRLPVARIHLGAIAHHARAGRWLMEKGLEILEAMGADEVVPARSPGAISHAMVHGTCRAGARAAASVLNPFCQAHEVKNLFVVDGSFMPTAGGAPSTLTILANSFRVADHIIGRVRAGDLR
jgi:choline dehydrogenase-like flavoprotein